VLARSIARLPPLWAVVVLFVGLTLPQALLGLPIAAAGIGPLPTLAIVVVVGALMTVTSAAEAEAIVRDREFRDGGGYFGKIVERYLGRSAAAIPDALAGLRTSLSVLGAYVGIAVTLASLTGVSRVVWGVLTFVLLALLLVRGGLKIPAAVGATLGLACLPLLIAIAVVAVDHGGGDLSRVELSDGPAIGSVIGLVAMIYIANVYVVEVAREELGDDPGGRALVRGSALGTVILTVIAAGWLLATSAALDPGDVAGEVGTVLGPLADETGAGVVVLGTATTLLLLGLGMERTSVAVMHLAAERLPSGPHGRLLAIAAPLAVCALGEVLLGADLVSFSDIFGVAGVVSNVVLGLVVPLLLLVASRAGGDEASASRVPLAGRPAVAGAILALDAVVLVAFATVLSDDVLRRAGAVVGLVALVATTVLAWRAGAFTRRAVSAVVQAPSR
jgi:amino acid permease